MGPVYFLLMLVGVCTLSLWFVPKYFPDKPNKRAEVAAMSDDRKRLLVAGARVNQVDEEGEVTVFSYTLGRSFHFHVAHNQAQAWGALLGKNITIEIIDEEFKQQPK